MHRPLARGVFLALRVGLAPRACVCVYGEGALYTMKTAKLGMGKYIHANRIFLVYCGVRYPFFIPGFKGLN